MASPSDPTLASVGSVNGRPSVRQRLVRGTLWSLIGTVAMLIASLLANVVLARILTQAELGAYFLAVSLVTTTAILGRLGLDAVMVRLVASAGAAAGPGAVRAVVRRVLWRAGAGATALGVVLAAGVGRWVAVDLFDAPALGRVVPLLAAWAAVEAARLVLSETFRGLHDLRAATLLGTPGQTVLATALFVGLAVSGRPAGAATASALAFAASLVVLLVAAISLGRRLAALGPPGVWTGPAVLSIGLPIMVSVFLRRGLNQGDLWIVGAARDNAEVGVYGAASRLANLTQVPAFVLGLAVAPLVAELVATGDRDRLERVVRGSATVAAAPMLALLAVVAVAGGPLLGLVFGPAYASGGAVLTLLALGQVVAAAVPSGTVLSMSGHQTLAMWLILASAVVATVGEALVVRPFGLLGVAAFSGGGTALQALLLAWFVRRRVGVLPVASVSPALARELLGVVRGGRRPG